MVLLLSMRRSVILAASGEPSPPAPSPNSVRTIKLSSLWARGNHITAVSIKKWLSRQSHNKFSSE
jgi:hypothetical protein